MGINTNFVTKYEKKTSNSKSFGFAAFYVK